MANFHVMAGARGVRVQPTVRQIDYGDLAESLRLGFDDFWQKPSHYVFLCLIYPIVGAFLIQSSSGANAIHLAYPLMSSFPQVGPLATIRLYEIRGRRELGLDSSWLYALAVRRSPALPSIAAVGAMLVALFLVWLYTAQSIYTSF